MRSNLTTTTIPHVIITYLYFKVFQKILLDFKMKMCFYEGGT